MYDTDVRRPSRAPDVQVHPPGAAGARWVVQRGGATYLRAGTDMARLLQALDGVRGPAELAAGLGDPWTARDVTAGLAALRRADLLDDGTGDRPEPRRLTVVPPLTLHLTLLRPEALMRRLAPVVRALATPTARVAGTVLVLAGVVAVVAQGPALLGALGHPLSASVLATLFVASVATTVLHEFAHASVLTHHGGRPTRMGVMLFYLAPAFFCDVTDGWRLPRREQRVQVALAGVATQVLVAAAAAVLAGIVALTAGGGDLRDGLLLFTVSTALSGLINLLPFVKLDGYLALMSAVDVPHLRDRAITDGRRALARLLFGGRYGRELPQLWWSRPYGLACAAFPVLLVAVAAAVWVDLLAGLGVVGSVIVVVGVALLLLRAAQGAVRLVGEARRAGVGRARVAATCGALAVALAALLLGVSVPTAVPARYAVAPDGTARLLLTGSADAGAVTAGAPVRLERRGLLVRELVGTATVAPGETRDGIGPLGAYLPVRELADVPVAVREHPLRLDGPPPAVPVGVARVVVGDRPLAVWLWNTYLAPAFR